MYPNLESVMTLKGITLENFAAALHIHRNTAANKLKGESDFTYPEAMIISEVLFPEYKASYLFKRKVEDVG